MAATTTRPAPAGCTWDLTIPSETHYGSYVAPGRYVLRAPGRRWAHLPATCPVSEVQPGEWIGTGEDEALVCFGCGLDCT
ncbi:hypothetical protein ADK91_02885 [Streptomyces sp. XY511]|uniref:hypothetical protein n=1 Tax=Streptomyces sp. XY511 TaxID=1519480 RepID=UPI0006AEEFF2|nr:hypothetical protein [Streptomyces sp. XY511]KOV17257.1 hypothetical protein ADK91_02885 [Streptomyces sp. XY511]